MRTIWVIQSQALGVGVVTKMVHIGRSITDYLIAYNSFIGHCLVQVLLYVSDCRLLRNHSCIWNAWLGKTGFVDFIIVIKHSIRPFLFILDLGCGCICLWRDGLVCGRFESCAICSPLSSGAETDGVCSIHIRDMAAGSISALSLGMRCKNLRNDNRPTLTLTSRVRMLRHRLFYILCL